MFKFSKYLNGALTSKAYAYKARSWELKKKLGLNFFEIEGSLVTLEYRDKEILRVIPKIVKTKLNFISDKIRFFYDSLKVQRLYISLWKNYKIGKLEKISWIKFFEFYIFFNKYIKNNKNIKILNRYYLGSTIGLKNILYLKNILNLNSLYYNNVIIDNMTNYYESLKENYILYENVINDIGILVFFGTNLANDYPILKIILKKKVNKLCYFGVFDKDNTNNILHFGNNIINVLACWKGKFNFVKYLLKEKAIYLFFSTDFFRLYYKLYIFLKCKLLTRYLDVTYLKMSTSYSELQSREYGVIYENTISNTNSIVDLEYVHFYNYDKFNYLFNLKNIDLKIYQGFQGFFFLKNMDFVLSQTSLFEEKNIFLDIFGVKKYVYRTFNKISEIKRSDKVLKNLLDVSITFNSIVLDSEVWLINKLLKLKIKNNTFLFLYKFINNSYKFKGVLSKQILLYYGDSNIVKLSSNLTKRLKIEKDMFYNFLK